MNCAKCGKPQDALISLKGSQAVEDEVRDWCEDCVKAWIMDPNKTFTVKPSDRVTGKK